MTERIGAIVYKDTPDARQRFAELGLNTDFDSTFAITLNGTDGNGSVVVPKFVQVDNFENISPVVVTINGIKNSVAPYTRTTFEIAGYTPELGIFAYEGIVKVYISEARLGIGDGTNDLAKDNAFNMGTYFPRDGSAAALADIDLGGFGFRNVVAKGIVSTAISFSNVNGVERTGQEKLRELPYSIKDAGCVGDGITDDTANFNKAVAAAKTLGRYIFIPVGTYLINSLIDLQGLSLVGESMYGSIIKQKNAIPVNDNVPGGAHQGQIIWARGNSLLQNFSIDGNNIGTGIVAAGENKIRFNSIYGFNNGTSGTGCQFFMLLNVDTFSIIGCEVRKAKFATQIWRCNNGVLVGNSFDQCEAGIFTVASTLITATANNISNMEDVGIDAEGGRDNNFSANNVQACANAELSIFVDVTEAVGCENIFFSANNVHRPAVYLKRDGTVGNVNGATGAFTIFSISNNAKNIVVSGNDIRVENNAGQLWTIQPDCGAADQDITISGNRFRYESTSLPFNIMARCNGLIYSHNTHVLTAGVTTSAVFKNVKNAFVLENVFVCKVAPVVPLILFYADAPGQSLCVFDGNQVYNASVKFDSAGSGNYTFQWGNNYVAGGIAAINGLLSFRESFYTIEQARVLSTRKAAVGTVSAAAAAPTKAEFDVLANKFNSLVDRLGATNGHGLIAD